MDISITLPDDVALRMSRRWQNLPRHALETLVADAYRAGVITAGQVRGILGLETPLEDLLGRYRAPDIRLSVEEAIIGFWEAFRHRIGSEAAVFTFAQPVDPSTLVDAVRQNLVEAPDIGPAHGFFVDQQPDANWAHECAYAFVTDDGATIWCNASWPPDESFALEPVAPP